MANISLQFSRQLYRAFSFFLEWNYLNDFLLPVLLYKKELLKPIPSLTSRHLQDYPK